MSNFLTAAYASPSTSTDYWLTIKQVGVEDDRASIEDVAEVVDELFELTPCTDPNDRIGGRPAEQDENGVDITQFKNSAEFWAWINEKLAIIDCSNPDSRTETLNIYRSHPAEPYRLTLNNGEIIETVPTIQYGVKLTLAVKAQSSIDLGFVPSSLTYAWTTAQDQTGAALGSPAVSVNGRTLSFGGLIVTGLLTITCSAACDQVTITVPNDTDGQPGECTALAYYAAGAYEKAIEFTERAELDETAKNRLCPGDGEGGGPDGPSECYERVRHVVRCQCSGQESDIGSWETEEDVTCPESAVGSGRVQVGSRSVEAGYTNCGERDEYLSDPDFYKRTCCTKPPFALPMCKTVHRAYGGGFGIPNPGNWPQGTRFVAVAPKSGLCGETVITQVIDRLNCCNEVDPLGPDPTNPTEILQNGSVLLRTLDGDLPNVADWVWTCSGTLFFPNGEQQVVGGAAQTVSAPADLCANNVVLVDDGCSQISMQLTVDVEELALNALAFDPDTLGATYLEVTGGVGPYTLTTTGEHTHFAGDEKEITLASPGVVILYVDLPQACLGAFSVAVSDGCAATDSVVLDPLDIPTGQVCVKYGSSSTCMVEWASGPYEITPRWYQYDGFGGYAAFTCTYNDATPPPLEGKYYYATGLGLAPRYVIITDPGPDIYGRARRAFVRWDLTNAIQIPNVCETC